MRIELISKEQHATLSEIQKKHSILTFQNNGYEYIDKSKFSAADKEAFEKVKSILSEHIAGFVEFNNFKITKNGEVQIRVQYKYDHSFTGVGYLLLDELLNGFNSTEES